jgi:hypothetical protein
MLHNARQSDNEEMEDKMTIKDIQYRPSPEGEG